MYKFDFRENERRNASTFCAVQTLHVWLCRSFKYKSDVYVLAQVNYRFWSMLKVSWNMFDDYFTQPWSGAAVQVGEKTSTVCVFICLNLYLNKSTKLMCIHTHTLVVPVVFTHTLHTGLWDQQQEYKNNLDYQHVQNGVCIYVKYSLCRSTCIHYIYGQLVLWITLRMWRCISTRAGLPVL